MYTVGKQVGQKTEMPIPLLVLVLLIVVVCFPSELCTCKLGKTWLCELGKPESGLRDTCACADQTVL